MINEGDYKMKKYIRNILIVTLCIFSLVTFAGCEVSTVSTDNPTSTEETEVHAIVTDVFKTKQYVPAAHQWLYTVRIDVAVDNITKTFVQTKYTLKPSYWSLKQGDVITCILVTTCDNSGKIISQKLK